MRSWLVAAVVGLLLAGCSIASEEPASAPRPSESPTQETTTATVEPSETAEPSADREDRLPEVHHRISLPALMRERPDGGRPRIVATELETDTYTRHQVVYRSGDLTVSGVLLRPKGHGPFPGIVLNHGTSTRRTT